jgi:L-threonylcarbamoyladenylate synthase
MPKSPALSLSKGPALSLSKGLIAPGLLPRHYSPHTPFHLFTDSAPPPAPSVGKRAAWVRLRRPAQPANVPAGVGAFLLSEDGNLVEAARDLYDLLRRLDQTGYDEIWCETTLSGSLGEALNDRLRRAAAQR